MGSLTVFNPDLLNDKGHCAVLFVLDVQNLVMKCQLVPDIDRQVGLEALLAMQQAAGVDTKFLVRRIGFLQTHHLQAKQIGRRNWKGTKACFPCCIDISIDGIGLAYRVHKSAALLRFNLYGRWRPDVTDVGLVDFVQDRDVPALGALRTPASILPSAESMCAA